MKEKALSSVILNVVCMSDQKLAVTCFLTLCIFSTCQVWGLNEPSCASNSKRSMAGDPESLSSEIRAVKGLIGRVTPSIANRFDLHIISSTNNCDVYELESSGDLICLRGNNGISLASAYNRYLQDYCKCLYSPWGQQMHLPDQLPVVSQKKRVVTQRKLRHFFNYCTFNYSGTWWDWKRWEMMIDWLAMNGINMPLNIVGVESVWYHTLLELGLTDEEARTCLAAPVYLSWQWMGNLEGTGGPLPKFWIDSHEKLGRQVMEREQSLGMTPISHGFSGTVPRLLKSKYPTANICIKPGWGRDTFLGVATLDPTDPLFSRAASIYLSQLIKRLGTSHLYMTDPFHESSPPVDGPDYLRKVARTIDQVLLKADPMAVWVTQDWTLRPDIIQSIPKDRLIIMSLSGGKVGEYRDWGYRYTVGQLNSFGGETHLHGNIMREAGNGVSQEIKKSPCCIGSGNWMEGLENAPAYYHFMLDLNWENESVDPEKQLEAYYQRRYGGVTDNIREMNRLLLNSAYQRGGHGFSSIICARPAVFPIKSSPVREIEVNKIALDKQVQAWRAMLAEREMFRNSKGYQYDVVDLGRQILATLAVYYQRDTAIYLHRKDLNNLHKAKEQFLDLLEDMDQLLATCDNFLFGKWVADARSWGKDEVEAEYYAKYAAMLVTLWGQDNMRYYSPNWQDYAGREWSGLISHYYKVRWSMFYDELEKRLREGVVFEDVMRDKWGRPLTVADTNGFYQKLYRFEITFAEKLPPVCGTAQGDAVDMAWALFNKYEAHLKSLPAEAPILHALFEPASYQPVAWTTGDQKSMKLKEKSLQDILNSNPYFSPEPKYE